MQKLLGRNRKAARFSHRHEITQMPQLHFFAPMPAGYGRKPTKSFSHAPARPKTRFNAACFKNLPPRLRQRRTFLLRKEA
jgi:hypothetical protein